ncbi:hypothetical protein SO802_014709, partial [Lithocarpus litseifolius]
MKGRLLLDIVICKSPSIFKLLSCKDKPLLVWWDTFLVLYLSLDIVNSVRAFNLQVSKGATIFKLLAGKDQPLL